MNLRPILVGSALLAILALGCRAPGATPIEGGGGGGVTPSPGENFGADLQPPAPTADPAGVPVLLPPITGPESGEAPETFPTSPVIDPEAGDAAPVPNVSPLRPGVENPSPLPTSSPSPL